MEDISFNTNHTTPPSSGGVGDVVGDVVVGVVGGVVGDVVGDVVVGGVVSARLPR